MNYSSLNLVFGNCPAYQFFADEVTEVESIFEVNTQSGGHYKGGRFTTSKFWKAFSKRLWQFDDFTFEGIAAASYLSGSHRFKIWFNPHQFYEFLFKGIVFKNIPIDEFAVGDEEAENAALKKHAEAVTKIMKKLETDEPLEFDTIFNRYGLHRHFLVTLSSCVKAGKWHDQSWYFWTNHVANNIYVSQNLDSVMVHEMQHVIWNHLSRCGSRDALQWNLATDHAINQNLDFTTELTPLLITMKNETFYKRFVAGVIRFLMMEDPTIKEEIKKNYKLTLENDVKDFFPVVKTLHTYYMLEKQGWQTKEKFGHKSADFYYRILLETCVFTEEPMGADGHQKWSEQGEEGEGQEGDGQGDKEGKGAGQGDKKGKGKADEAGNKPNDQKQRGKGEGAGQEHQGFDVASAASRAEVKGAIRDALEKTGCDPDDPAEIERALNRIPGMDVLGAYIKDFFKVRTKNWKQILQSNLTSYMNPTQMDYTMSREDRRRKNVFPGKKKDVGLDVIIGVDTSGSINHADYNDFVNQIEKIVKDCDLDTIRLIQCHHSIAFDKNIPARRLKQTAVKETGGTRMAVIYEKLKRERNKKLLILFTDGFIDTFSNEDWGFKSIMFLSRGAGSNKEMLENRGFKVICQDEE